MITAVAIPIVNTMSADEAEVVDFCCASCGIAEVDDVKLKNCADCDLVRYCCDSCRQDHKPKHEVSCRERAAALRDEVLFRQPESSHLGDCPICLLPLPIDTEQPVYFTCCSKVICQGCSCAISSQTEEQVECPCPFCREDIRKSDKNQNILKRVAANDPVALQEMGMDRFQEGNYVDAFEYWTKASEMGDAESHLRLSLLYWRGRGVEKDEKKEIYHLEEAAIAGHPDARYMLASYEWESGRIDRAVKHWIIAVNLGHEQSMQALKLFYAAGKISKDQFDAALRANHAAIDAMKSPQREAAKSV